MIHLLHSECVCTVNIVALDKHPSFFQHLEYITLYTALTVSAGGAKVVWEIFATEAFQGICTTDEIIKRPEISTIDWWIEGT